MLIDCPSCSRAYHISRAALGESGRTVICPTCMTRWFVETTAAVPPDRLTPAFDTPLAGSANPDTHLARSAIRADPSRDRGISQRARPSQRARKATPRDRPAGLARQIGVGFACLVLAMGAIGKRTAIVRAAPRTAALYGAIGLPVNVRGLAFEALTTTRLGPSGDSVSITGTIRNVASTRNVLPRITFEMRDAQGATLASWSQPAPKPTLAADESVAFLAQAPSLPRGCKDVLVRFATHADLTSDPPAMLLHQARSS